MVNRNLMQTCTARDLEKRIDELRLILERSNNETYHNYRKIRKDTGFQPLHTGHLQRIVQDLVKLGIDARTPSLDMGCGNGGFALFAAAAGFPSYGIDINPDLISEARKNKRIALEQGLISPETACEFAVGNMYPREYAEKYKEYVLKSTGKRETVTLPTESNTNPYEELGIDISDFGIIYSFPWDDQMEFLTKFLAEKAKDEAVFALPHEYILKYLPVKFKKIGKECIWRKD